MEESQITGIIERACKSLCKYDATLLERGLNERTMTSRLAIHLQRRLPKGYYADCEYNKAAYSLESKFSKVISRWPERYKELTGDDRSARVYPDIIIHKRTFDLDDNIAVIEAKWHKEARDLECEKISYYVTEETLRYRFGYFLLLGKKMKPDLVARRDVQNLVLG